MPMPSEYEFDWISNVLRENSDKQFVRRINEISSGAEDFPRIENKDGSISTHSMATGEADGMYYAYPTVMEDKKGVLQRYPDDKAFKRAIEKGDFIRFNTEKEADLFSRRYKSFWPMRNR